MGYFGLSYALENEGKVKTLEVDDGDGCVAPTNETVQDGSYKPLSRPLFIYPSGKALAERGRAGVRPVLRGQLRHDRRAGEVRPDDRRAGAAVQGRRRPAGGRSWKQQSRAEAVGAGAPEARRLSCFQAPVRGDASSRACCSCARWSRSSRRSASSSRSPGPTIDFFEEVTLGEYFTGTDWAPLFSPSSFGVLPLVVGTLSTTFWACVVAMPFGLGAAIYLSEYAQAALAALAEARARGAGRDPDRGLRLLRAHVRHAAAAGHRARRSRSSTPCRPAS